jgi:hypothetical protein
LTELLITSKLLKEEKIAKANQEWMTNMMTKADEDKNLYDMREEEEYLIQFYKKEKELYEKEQLRIYWENKNKGN